MLATRAVNPSTPRPATEARCNDIARRANAPVPAPSPTLTFFSPSAQG